MTDNIFDYGGEAPACVPLSWREQLIEVLVFLSLIVPSMVLSLFFSSQGGSFVLLATATIVRDLALIGLILFFLWHNGERDQRIGWTFQHGGWEIALGVMLFLPLLFLSAMLAGILQHYGFTVPRTTPSYLVPHGAAQLWLGFLLVVVVALAEETIFRGYLILRLNALTRNLGLAVVLSAVIFSLGHGYEGSAGLVVVGFIGLVYALIYVWRRSLVAPITMHFLQDFLVIVIAPWLGWR